MAKYSTDDVIAYSEKAIRDGADFYLSVDRLVGGVLVYKAVYVDFQWEGNKVRVHGEGATISEAILKALEQVRGDLFL
jgi:hypothetical protein